MNTTEEKQIIEEKKKSFFGKIGEHFKKQEPLGRYIIGALILVLLYAKAVNFYLLLDTRAYSLIFAAFTALYVSVLYFLVSLFSTKAANITGMVWYVILSLCFAIAAVCFRYMGQMPSMARLGNAGEAAKTKNAVKALISWRHIIMLSDFPLWIAYGIIHGIRKKKGHIGKVKLRHYIHTICTAAGILLLVAFAAVSISNSKFDTEILGRTEFFEYYAKDVKNLIKKETRKVSAWKYSGNNEDGGSPYTGAAEGRNLVIIQVEALQNFLIGAEYNGQQITPCLNSLIGEDSLYFDNYYYQIGAGNTCDAEFTVNNSLFANAQTPCYQKYTDYDYYGLPKLLKDNGFTTATVFHGYERNFWSRETAYPYQGFDDFISLEDFAAAPDFNEEDEIQKWVMGGISDESLFRRSADIMATYEEPFYSFVITLSSHYAFGIDVDQCGIDLGFEFDSMNDINTVQAYVEAAHYFDTALGEFIDEMKENGLYDNSIFVIFGDHYAVSNTEDVNREEFKKITGRDYSLFDRFNVPLIIHIPGMEHEETIHTVGGHIDLLPTILDLYGIKNEKSVMFGHNLLAEDYDGVVYEMIHAAEGSYITENIFYLVSQTGDKVYTKDGSEPGDVSQYKAESEKAVETIEDARALLDQNKILFENQVD